jgi:hypothetical protein
MNTEKLIDKAVKEIIAAFKKGHVADAAEAFYPYRAFHAAIRPELKGKIPMIFIERICRVPETRR